MKLRNSSSRLLLVALFLTASNFLYIIKSIILHVYAKARGCFLTVHATISYVNSSICYKFSVLTLSLQKCWLRLCFEVSWQRCLVLHGSGFEGTAFFGSSLSCLVFQPVVPVCTPKPTHALTAWEILVVRLLSFPIFFLIHNRGVLVIVCYWTPPVCVHPSSPYPT